MLEQAELYLSARNPVYDPFLLTGMVDAVKRLLLAIDQNEKIAVYGDYDVDGVTATALMVQVLQRLGASVDRHIPNRFEEGYGLNTQSIDRLS